MFQTMSTHQVNVVIIRQRHVTLCAGDHRLVERGALFAFEEGVEVCLFIYLFIHWKYTKRKHPPPFFVVVCFHTFSLSDRAERGGSRCLASSRSRGKAGRRRRRRTEPELYPCLRSRLHLRPRPYPGPRLYLYNSGVAPLRCRT